MWYCAADWAMTTVSPLEHPEMGKLSTSSQTEPPSVPGRQSGKRMAPPSDIFRPARGPRFDTFVDDADVAAAEAFGIEHVEPYEPWDLLEGDDDGLMRL